MYDKKTTLYYCFLSLKDVYLRCVSYCCILVINAALRCDIAYIWMPESLMV